MDITELIGKVMEKIPKKQEPDISAQKTLLLDKVWQDGMVRVHGAPPVYSKTIRFSDTNYTLLNEDSRRRVIMFQCHVEDEFVCISDEML